MDKHQRGKLIVIEGGDGSGKGTQSRLLQEYLQQNQIPFEYVDFPNYSSFYGQMVGEFLRGEYGDLKTVSPYLASLLFALDRKTVQAQIESYLADGKIVLANRYVTSNIAHQGSKFENLEERKKFVLWLEELEYSVNGMPKENIVIFLKVPAEAAMKLTLQKEQREYLKGEKVDIQEKDTEYRKKTEEMYEYLAGANNHWKTIECTVHGTMISKEKIHEQIISLLKHDTIL